MEEKSSGRAVASAENCGACMEINLEYTRALVQVKVIRVHLTHKVKAHRGLTKVVNKVEGYLYVKTSHLVP